MKKLVDKDAGIDSSRFVANKKGEYKFILLVKDDRGQVEVGYTLYDRRDISRVVGSLSATMDYLGLEYDFVDEVDHD